MINRNIEINNLTSSSNSREMSDLVVFASTLFSSVTPKLKKPENISKVSPNKGLEDDTDFEPVFYNFELKIDYDLDSTENIINKSRSSYLNKNFTRQFIDLLKEENFEFGMKTRSEEILNEQLKINELATRNWLNEIFVNNFRDEKIIIGILRIIGRFDPGIIFPQGQTIALAALVHKHDEIKDLGIRAFENWGTSESLEILKTVEVVTPWLKEYLSEVISNLEKELWVC